MPIKSNALNYDIEERLSMMARKYHSVVALS
jgi:hypothetical protein